MPKAGRLGDRASGHSDSHGCPGCPHPVVGPAISGSPNVNANGKPVLRVDDRGIHAACCGENTWVAAQGSETVLVNGMPWVRAGDMVRLCGGVGKLIEGSDNVNVGGASANVGRSVNVGNNVFVGMGGGATAGSAASAAAGSGGAGQQAAQSQAHSDAAGTHAKGPIRLPALTIEGKKPATDSTSTDAAKPQPADKTTCNKLALFSNGDGTVFHVPGEKAIFFTSHMNVDVDGSPNAYHPKGHDDAGNESLDFLANAGGPGDWYGVVTDNGQHSGNPLVQKPGNPDKHPFPGFYISATTLHDINYQTDDVRRYVDATKHPFIVLPLRHPHGCTIGDLCAVCYAPTQQIEYAVYADAGPASGLGESSAFLADQFGFPTDLRWKYRHPKGKPPGVERGVIYVVFQGSSATVPWPLSNAEIAQKAGSLFDAWGGVERLKKCFPNLFSGHT